MKLLERAKSKMTKDKNGENAPYLEITEVIHCNVVNNSYPQNSRVLYTFVPNKSFGQLLNISPENFIFFFRILFFVFLYIEAWFTDQNSNPLGIEDKINITLVINIWKMTRYSVQARDRIFAKCYGFLSFAKNMGKTISKNLSGKHSQKILDHAKQSAIDALKTPSKRVIQKRAAAIGDVIGKKSYLLNLILLLSYLTFDESKVRYDNSN